MKVCIIFIIAAVFHLLWTNDIYITTFDILIFLSIFFISYIASFCIDKYLRQRRERKNFELIIQRLTEKIQNNVPSEQLHTD